VDRGYGVRSTPLIALSTQDPPEQSRGGTARRIGGCEGDPDRHRDQAHLRGVDLFPAATDLHAMQFLYCFVRHWRRLMGESNLQCGSATNLFYEPEGLLLRSCLLPADEEHLRHLLTFQLGYLGSGEITVDVALEGGPAARIPAGLDEPTIAVARLVGADTADGEASRHGCLPATAHLSYTTVTDGPVQFKYTVWGQAAVVGDSLRGELSAVVSGQMPHLTVAVRSGATRTTPCALRRAPQTGCPTNGAVVHEHC
jgi:hypothetical protein